MVVVGTLAVHALVGALLLAIDRHPASPPPRASLSIEVVDPPPAPMTKAAAGEGGSASTPRATAASRTPRARPAQRKASTDVDPRGAITFERGSGSGGEGEGTGAGRGAGIGFGTVGGDLAFEPLDLTPPPAPSPPKAAKTRPARLVFPSRQREVDEGELFVMQVTVDSDGLVSGARLVRGFGGPRDEVAQNQIWRFRYDPALDDEGRPIRSVVEQRFLVQ